MFSLTFGKKAIQQISVKLFHVYLMVRVPLCQQALDLFGHGVKHNL